MLLAKSIEIIDVTDNSPEVILNELRLLDGDGFDRMVVDPETLKVRGDKPWFIKFYAPWCGHCKALAPIWSSFHSQYGSQLNIAKVDCTDSKSEALCK